MNDQLFVTESGGGYTYMAYRDRGVTLNDLSDSSAWCTALPMPMRPDRPPAPNTVMIRSRGLC